MQHSTFGFEPPSPRACQLGSGAVAMSAVGALERCRGLARELVAAVNAEVAGGVPDKVRGNYPLHRIVHQQHSRTILLDALHSAPIPKRSSGVVAHT